MFKEITVVLYLIVIVLSQNEKRCNLFEDNKEECIYDIVTQNPGLISPLIPETTDNPDPIDQDSEYPQERRERIGREIKRDGNNEWGLVWQQFLTNERRYSSPKAHALSWITSTHMHLPYARNSHRTSGKPFAQPFNQIVTAPYYAIVIPKSLKY